MAANDVTVSLAVSSDSSIKVHTIKKLSTNTLPKSGGDPVVVAANGNTVINLAPGDTLVVERLDHPETIMKHVPLRTKEKHGG